MSAVLEKFMLEHFTTYGATGNLTHARGVEYKQLFNHYPALEPFYGDFEKSFDP
eukprot:gene23314-26389_t